MKNNFRIAAAFLLLIFLSSTSAAVASDVPLLTWAKGKTKSVVLGGASSANSFQVFLKSSDLKMIQLSPSLSNKAGFVVYSISVPRDISEGAYSVVTRSSSSSENLVAAVQIVEMRRYEITRIPSDLLFFLMSLALWFSSLAALRGKKFRKVTFVTSTGPKERYLAGEPAEGFIEYAHKLNRLEKLRINVYEQLPDSFFKFLLKSDSRGLHLEFPIVWSFLPAVAMLISGVLGFTSRNSLEMHFSGLSLAIFLSIAFIGSIDIYSGILGALTFIAVRLWLLSDFSISSIAATFIISLPFFLPALISIYFVALISGVGFSNLYKAANIFIFQWLSPIALIHTIFLLQRSITGSTSSTVGIEAMLIAMTLVGRKIEEFLSSNGIKSRKRVRIVEEFEVILGRLISPSFAVSVLFLQFVIIYTWTLRITISIYLSLALSIPLALLMIRPTSPKLRFAAKIKRDHLLEIGIVSAFSLATFFGIQKLPLVSGSDATQIIFLGLSPVFIHALISCAADVSERVENEENL